MSRLRPIARYSLLTLCLALAIVSTIWHRYPSIPWRPYKAATYFEPSIGSHQFEFGLNDPGGFAASWRRPLATPIPWPPTWRDPNVTYFRTEQTRCYHCGGLVYATFIQAPSVSSPYDHEESILVLPYWFTLLIYLAYPAWFLLHPYYARWKIRRRIARALCAVCTYDLRAHLAGRAGPRCPECGTVIPTPSEPER